MSNSFSCVGNLGKDGEVRTAGNGTVTGFSLATKTGFGDREATLWISCSIWGVQGERLAQFLKKGTSVFVSGELSQREYNDKMYLELNVKSFDFAGPPKESQPDERNPQPSTDEDVPF